MFIETIEPVRTVLLERLDSLEAPMDILKASELKTLYANMGSIAPDKKADYGKAVNELRRELEDAARLKAQAKEEASVVAIDVTAPWAPNTKESDRPGLLSADDGSMHPLMKELWRVIEIFTRMGFRAVESRQLDDDFHMFASLNFPEGHPARDGYDTFMTKDGLIAPAHTSTMQNRILVEGKSILDAGGTIASISYGRVFRNEDIDATHEHTFYQVEGVYVAADANLSQMLATLRSFFEAYYGQRLKIKTQPAYFPFTEPGLEFLIEKPASIGGTGNDWLEMLGCGMIHPNVLRAAGIDPDQYKGFAWGGGVERLVMLKYGIDDLRYFESGKLAFLKEFA